MRKVIILFALMCVIIPLTAARHKKKSSNPKFYMQERDMFFFDFGMYVAYPSKFYRINQLYFSKKHGYYTYKSKLTRIPLDKIDDELKLEPVR